MSCSVGDPYYEVIKYAHIMVLVKSMIFTLKLKKKFH